MSTLTYNLSSFTRTNTDMAAGTTFNCYASGSAVSNAYITSASLYLSSIRTYVAGCYLDFTLGSGSGSTSSFSNNSSTHSETVSVNNASAALLSAGSQTMYFTVRRSSGGSGNALNIRDGLSGTLTLNYEIYPSACGAPSSASVNTTVSEGNVTLSWSGAASGTNNAISSYEIQYSESSDNTSWGSWVALTTVSTTATSGSVSVAPPSTRGYYRRFQVRTRGSAGASYYSGWRVSSNSVRRATLPTAPTACTVSATLSEANVTLSWSGAASGAGHTISSYEVQYSESSDNSSWGSWVTLTTVTTTATSGSASVAPPSTRGYYRHFQVRAIPSTGASYASAWRVSSNSVRRNTLPTAPTTLSASPTVYWNQDITLSWSGAAAGTSAIARYDIQHCTSTDGSSWGAWAALTTVTSSATSGSRVITPSQTQGTYTKYRISATDTLGVASAFRESNSVRAAITACGAPTACSLSATLAEGNATLSWSGATAGSGNAIAAYEIQYSDSTDNASWGAWTALSVVNSTSSSGNLTVSPPDARGSYRRFQVRTRGSAGASYYSAWRVSASVRKNVLPTPPTVFTALPEIYEVNNITLTWSGAIAGTSAITQTVIQVSVSANGGAWSAYELLATINGTGTSGSRAATPSDVAGVLTRYRICIVDSLGGVSAYTISNTVRKLSPPLPPIITAPQPGSITYNTRPRFLLRCGESYTAAQAVCVRTASEVWEDSYNNPSKFSPSGYLQENSTTIYRHAETTVGNKTVAFRAFAQNIGVPGADVSRSLTVAASPFEAIAADETKVKAAHILSLRTVANAARTYYGMAAIVWSEEITAGRTPIRNWPFHVVELRNAIEQVIAMISTFAPGSSLSVPMPDWLPLTPGRPQAAVMLELQDILLQL